MHSLRYASFHRFQNSFLNWQAVTTAKTSNSCTYWYLLINMERTLPGPYLYSLKSYICFYFRWMIMPIWKHFNALAVNGFIMLISSDVMWSCAYFQMLLAQIEVKYMVSLFEKRRLGHCGFLTKKTWILHISLLGNHNQRCMENKLYNTVQETDYQENPIIWIVQHIKVINYSIWVEVVSRMALQWIRLHAKISESR